jgi:hypothetical protein
VQDSRETAANDGTGQAWVPLRQRLEKLRERLRKEVTPARIKAQAGSFILAACCFYFAAVLAIQIVSHFASHDRLNIAELAGLLFMMVIAIAFFIKFTAILLSVHDQYDYHRKLAWHDLLYGDLALFILRGVEYRQFAEIFHQRNNDAYADLPREPRLERYLELSCGFIKYLRALERGEEIDFMNPRSPEWLVAFNTLSFKSTLTLIFSFLFLPLLGIVVSACENLLVRNAMLVAFLDFMLEEPPPWVGQLTPPDETKRPWWWRSLAPLMRE